MSVALAWCHERMEHNHCMLSPQFEQTLEEFPRNAVRTATTWPVCKKHTAARHDCGH